MKLLNVLLLDARDEESSVLQEQLCADGRFGVQRARSLSGALESLAESSVDVVLMDLNLVDSVGFGTFDQLNKAYPGIPFVILTGDDDLEDARQSVMAGAQDYVPRSEGDISVLSRSLLYAHERSERQVMEKRQEVVDRDLEVARTIQQHLLPPQSPDIPGFDVAALCRPVEACGGDFYDIIQRKDSWDLMIADVSGHGFAPAMIMAQTQTLLRALADRLHDVGELVTAVNTELCRDTPAEHFVSMFYARLCPRTRTATYTIAGHPAVIFRANGEIEPLEEGGTVLGVDPDVAYPTHGRLQLASGDRLVLMTDGIQEVASPKHGLFGKRRFYEAIQEKDSESSRDAIRHVVDVATRFATPEPVQDDITIVMLRCLTGD